jgi:hypothetical protein
MSNENKTAQEQRLKMTRLQMSRYEVEKRNRRIVVIGAAVVAALTLGLVIAAAVQIGVVEPSRTVASVGGTPISVQALQKRMRLTQQGVMGNAQQLQSQLSAIQASGDQSQAFIVQFYQQQLQQIVSQGSAEAVAQQTYQQMVDDLLIRQESAKRNIAVSADEVQTELEKGFGLYRATLTPFPTTTAEPTVVISGTAIVPPTPEPRLQPTSLAPDQFTYQLAQRVNSLSSLGFTEADLRQSVESDLYRTKLQEAYGAQVETSAPHYSFDFVRFNVITDAVRAADRLAKREIGFEALISETNAITLPTSIGNGQSVDWTSETRVLDLYGPEVLDVMTYKAIGAPTQIVTSTNNGGIYILVPRGRETRPYDADELDSLKRSEFDKWLQGARLDANLVKKEVEPFEIIPATVRSTADAFMRNFGQPGGVPGLPQ